MYPEFSFSLTRRGATRSQIVRSQLDASGKVKWCVSGKASCRRSLFLTFWCLLRSARNESDRNLPRVGLFGPARVNPLLLVESFLWRRGVNVSTLDVSFRKVSSLTKKLGLDNI